MRKPGTVAGKRAPKVPAGARQLQWTPTEEALAIEDRGAGVTRNEEIEACDDPLAGVAFGPLLFEKFLLAIIDAVKGSKKTRLNRAMMALVGRESSPNPPPGDPDDAALLWMASEHYGDLRARRGRKHNIPQKDHRKRKDNREHTQTDQEPRVRSDLELANAAAIKILKLDPKIHPAPMHRLRQKFSGTYQREKLRRGGNERSYRLTYMYRAEHHDYVVESLEWQALKRLSSEFAKWGISLNLNRYG